jgi:hypothetical protein
MSSPQTMTVLIEDQQAKNDLSFSSSVQVVDCINSDLESAINLFVLTSATNLSNVSELVTRANQRHHLRVLFIREDIPAMWLPQMFDRANLRVMRNTLIHKDAVLPQRVINAWSWGAQDQLIANATVIGNCLLVFSCAMEKLEVKFDVLPILKTIPIEDRSDFNISEEGSYLHWPKQDIHLDLDVLRYAIDPNIKRQFDAYKLTHDQLFGKAIAALRKQYKLRQSDIIDLSERQVSRIEKGEGTKVETLDLFAKAHKMELNDYLEAVASLMSDI